MATTKKAKPKKTRKFSPAQLAAQKRFAEMAKARSKKKSTTKASKKKTTSRAPKKPRTVKVSTRAKKPEHYYIVAVVDGKSLYYDGAKSLGPKSQAEVFVKSELATIAKRVDKGLKSHSGIRAVKVRKK